MKFPQVYHVIQEISPIPSPEWVSAEGLLIQRKYPKKSKLLSIDDQSGRFFFVLSGVVRIFYINDKGREFTKSFMQAGDIASAYSEMLQGQTSRVSIECLADSEILELSYKDFLNLQAGSPAWKNLALKMTEKYFIFRDQREYELLVLSTKERYDRFVKQFPALLKTIPQIQIASYLGVTPVSLSRVLTSRKSS